MAAGNSVIGALRVSLGLDSAEFTSGLKKAESSLGSFGRAAGYGLAAVAAAAAAATVALGVAVKGAIDHADALGKAAQKAGVTVEALSRLEYAAKQSDVSLESLTGGLGKLSKGMADAAMNAQSTSGVAFKALGISVTEADGKLRSSADVITDLADRFSRLEDGATKTALAQQIFGKSGADLIPLLNSGADGLRQMADESDRLGVTISGKTANAANKFNDTLSRIGAIMQGVVNQVMEAALPALQSLADTLASPEFAKAAKQLAVWITDAMNLVVQSVTTATNAISGLLSIAGVGPDKSVTTPYTAADYNNAARMAAMNGSDKYLNKKSTGDLYSGFSFGKGGQMDMQSPANLNVPNFDVLGGGADKAKDKIADLRKGLEAIAPAAANAQKLASDSLKGLADNALGSLGNLSGALSSLFKQNKAFAVSTAILQGLQGVAYALGSSAPPWNFINAAAVGIEAAANVASILSTTENSTSMPGGSGSSGGQAAAAASQSSAINLTIKGSGNINVDDFASQLTKSIADGGNQQLVKVIRAA